ncbi:MAG TPA: GDP-mannose 4,6-dehydratase [Candidatus Paceibacterota bacterium]|nr:GDP-mannose 4,6-dehydratase [Candidatus Paceibacterota bacterium]
MKKKALIFGITGQDGSYLAELLLARGYETHGVIRRASTFNTSRIDHLYQDPHVHGVKFFLHFGDLADGNTIRKLLYSIAPDEVYNLGAQSHVRVSFDIPEYTANVTGVGTLRVLEAIKDYEEQTKRKVRFYQASSSEMFGSAPPPQNERTPFHPRSPYGIAKTFAYYTTVNYREAYGMFAVNGILFNHESERRGETFVTRKIARAVARIKLGLEKKLYLGNLDARRDWGYAPEYVEAMWLMLQQSKPEDFVIGTGKSHTVREFAEAAFREAGYALRWEGKGKNEKGIDKRSGAVLIEIDPRYYRPAEVDDLRADASKANRQLGWKPKTTFGELAEIMVRAELKALAPLKK